MKFGKNNKYFQWGFTAFLVIVASICFYYLMFHGAKLREGIRILIDILMPVVFGLVTAFVLTPVLNFVEYRILIPICDKIKIKKSSKRQTVIRGIGIVVSIFLLCFIIYSLISMMLSQIVPSVINIVNNFDRYANNFVKWLNKMLAAYPDVGDYIIKTVDNYSEDLEKWLNDLLFNKTSDVIKTISVSTINVLRIVWNLLIGFIISVYLLASKEKFAAQAKKITYALFSKNTANIIINNFRFTNKTFTGFLSGKIVDSILIGMFCFIGTTLMQTPYASLISVIIGVTNVIPFFGPYLGAIPSIILVFIVDPTHPLNCVYFAIFIILLQQFDGNFLGPKILGESTGLTGFWVIFAITFFGGLLGVFGMIIGVPLFAVIYAAINSFVNARLAQKDMSRDTKDYMDVAAIDEKGFHEYIPDYRLKKSERDKSLYGKNFYSNFADMKEQLFPEEKIIVSQKLPAVEAATTKEAVEGDAVTEELT